MTTLVDDVLASTGASPDLVIIDGKRGDFAIGKPGDALQPYNLRGGQDLATAIALCLMCDARAAPDKLWDNGLDRRGWPGDGFDVDTARGEAPLGSLIWVRRRYPANAANARQVSLAAMEALKPLVRQGLIAEPVVTASPAPASNAIGLNITLTSPSGRPIYDGPYAGLWQALDARAFSI